MERFPHLVTDQLMHHVFHNDSGVTTLEPRKWVKGVDKAGLLNMFLGTALQPHAHNHDNDQAVVMLSARWVPVARGYDTDH